MRLSEVAKAAGAGLIRRTADTPWWKASGPASAPVKRARLVSTDSLLAQRSAADAKRAASAPKRRLSSSTGFAGASGSKPWVTARSNAADSWQ
jgi:hypothetical protein